GKVGGGGGLLAAADGVVAHRRGTLCAERLHLVDDLGGIRGPAVLCDHGAVAHQCLTLAGREPVVVPQVHRRGGDAVHGAPGDQEGVDGGEEQGAREHAQRRDGAVDDVRPPVVTIVDEQLVGSGGIVVGVERTAGELLDDRIGV